MSNTPPPDIQAAALKVQQWLDQQEGSKSVDEIIKMTPAERLDYTRMRSQQTQMPDWKDPRK